MSNIRVAVRVRPLSEKEKEDGSREIIEINRSTVTIENVKVLGIPEFGDSRTKFKEFSYDHCYDCLSREQPYATQLQVFQDLGTQVLSSALDGFNACVFAYGQTGTGKTHTMMGYPGDVGLTPRICEGLFESIAKCADEKVTCRVDISYLEIYNEQIRDLLQPEQLKQNKIHSLKIREHPKEGPYVKDLSWHRVREYNDVEVLLDRGNTHRVTAETYIHDHSSRSHAIVTVCFTQARLEENRPSEIVSKINLVDLAGSERADPSSRPDFRKRLAEGSSINKSLVTLGYVIKALAEKSLLSWSTEDMGSTQSFHGSGGGEASASSSPAGPNRQRMPFIPYRDSVLTRLLKDSLGGNSKTIMIATITPASQFYGETLSTLRYAHRAKNIINKPRINEDSNVSLIRELRREIERLREMLASAQKAGCVSPCEDIMYFVPSFSIQQDSDQGGNLVNLQDSEDTIIAEKLHESEAMAKQLTQSWISKWSSTHNIMKETDLSIRNLRNRSSSMGVMIDSQLPYLVGMDDDVLSTGVVLFHLKEGETTIGREDAETAQDIVLMGPNIQPEHCVIQHFNGEVRVHPLPGAMTAIQGLECTEPTRLAQGDFIVFGGDQFFRFNNPAEAAKLREHRRSQGSLNTLNTSYPSFGGLSRASSYSSIGADDPNFLSPNSLLGRSYPYQRRHSDIVIRELERKHNTEQERLAEARSKLEQLQEEHERAEEVRLEKEEEMYSLHEQHRQEIEEQKQQLARLIEENERARQKSEEELLLAKESLAKEKEAFQQDLDVRRKSLKVLQKSELGQESAGIQTEPLSVRTSSTDTLEVKGISMGTDCEDDDTIKEEVPIKKGRRMSVEDQLKELEYSEFSRRMSYRETEASLSIQQEDIEDQYYQTQERIEEKMKKIKQIEEEYREMDKEFLSHMSEQTEKVDALHREEVQLEVYIQENEELMNVTTDVPRPLRSACSEAYLLDPNLQVPSYPVKTSSLRDINADLSKEGTLKASDMNILSASAESMKSDIVTMETDSRDKIVKPKTEKKDSKKITGAARDVTSRLYKPPEPKFKYVPKVKEKEVKPAQRSSRVRDGETKSRSSPSRFLPGHSPSPQRSKHSPSPMRQNGERSSPSPARGIEPKKAPTTPPTKPAGKKPAEKGPHTKTGGKESKVMAVRNKPQGSKQTESERARALSPESSSCGSLSPDRANLSPGPGPARPVNAKLRQMASASSLASVPESVSEEIEESMSPRAAPEPISYVVKRRAKKGRQSLFDDEFRTHSAPDSQNMEKALDDYTLQMMSGLSPEKHSSERVIPVLNTSVSVDDSDLQRHNTGDGVNDNKQEEIHSDDELAKEGDIENMDEGINESSVVLGKRDHPETVRDNLESPVLSPRKRSKSEGADDHELWHVTLNNNNKVNDNVREEYGHYSEDSLNSSDVSADSLEDGDRKSKRLTQSLPAYLVRDEKPISDDSLNDSLEDKKNSSKEEEIMETDQTEQSHDIDNTNNEKNNSEQSSDQTVRSLSRTEVECLDVYDGMKDKTNLSVSVLPQIDINDTKDQHNSGEKTLMDTGTVTDKLVVNEDQINGTPGTSTPAHAGRANKQKLEIVNLANVSYLANSDSEQAEQDEKMQEPELDMEESDIPDIESGNSVIPKDTPTVRSEASVKIEVPFNVTKPEMDVSSINGQYPQIVSENVACVPHNIQTNESGDNNRGINDEEVLEVSEEMVPDNDTCDRLTEGMHGHEARDQDTEEIVQKSKQYVEDIVTKAKEIVNEQIKSEAECAIQQSKNDKDSSINGPVLEEIMNTDAIYGELSINGDVLNIPASNTAEEMLQDSEVVKPVETEPITCPMMESAITQQNNTEDESTETIPMATSPNDLNNSQVELTNISDPNVNGTPDNVPNLHTTLPTENTGEGSEMEDHKQESGLMTEPEVCDDQSVVMEASSAENCGLVLTKSIGVGTSLECLAIEEDAEKTLLGSDDSLVDPEKELQDLKDALDQLPARPLSSGPQLSEARRAARQRAMIRQQQRAADSDGVEPCSDESPPSGNRSKASSRPDSGSRRRKRPQNKLNDKTKQLNDHTSDDYDSSENDSVYSDGSVDNKLYQGQLNGCPNREKHDNGSYVTTDSLENSDSDTMSRRLRKHHGKGLPRYDKERLDSADIEEGPDGKRTVGIQTFDQSRVRSASGRTDLSDFDSSCAIGDMGRNMTVSPLSLWNSDRRDSGSHSARNSSSSACVGQGGSDQDKSFTPTPRSSTRSVSSVFSENSNLGRGVTDVWSNSESDLRDLPQFNDEHSFLMETESSIPGLPSLDISEDGHSNLSFVKSPREGESVVSRPGCSTPKNPGQIVRISYPESQVEKATNLDSDTPVTFEVTVHENNTNILYNVEKTEYKTYALKNSDSDRPQIVPDTIHVNLTENNTSKTDEKYVSSTTEDVRMHLPHNGNNVEDGNLNSERSMRSSYSSERESETENNQVKHTSTRELKESIEDNTQYSVPSNSSFEEPVRKKNVSLQHSGLVEATNYPACSSDTDMPQGQQKSSGDTSKMDDSDCTSDYGTFISVDGRRASDSEGETPIDSSPGISPRASHISRRQDIDSEPSPDYNQSRTSFLPIATALEITDQLDSGIIMTQSQSLCSTEDVINPIVIAARTSQSSPVQFVNNPSLEAPVLSQTNDSEGNEDQLSLPEDVIPESSSSPSDMLDDTDSGSCSTVRPKHTSDKQSLACSQETLDDPNADFAEAAEADELKTTDSKTSDSVISPRQNKSVSSADDLYISLEQTESNSSTCSSEYKTPQQSPRNAESNDTSEHIKEVVIPDLGEDMTTPRMEEGVSPSGPVLTSSPKEPPSVRTVSVNTEASPPSLSTSPRSSKIKEVFGGPHDPIQTEAVRREIENKIARLQHTVRSLSDSAISSDYTDCDSSSPRGNRVYDSDRKLINKRQRDLANISKSPKRMEKVTTDPRRTLNFENEAVQKFPFKDSGNVLDEESNSQNEGEGTELDEDMSKPSVLNDANGKMQQNHGKLQFHFIPLAKPVGKFPETVVGAVLALKPFPLQRSLSLDSIATLVNTGTSLSRAARESQSIEDLSNGNQMTEIQSTVKEAYPFVEQKNKRKKLDVHDQYGQPLMEARRDEVDENEYLLSSGGLDSHCGDRSLSPGEIGIGQGSIDDMVAAVDNEIIVPDVDIPVTSVSTKRVPEKATSMSFLDQRHNPEYLRSLSEGNIDDLEDNNDTSCTSNDSITFVFVGKEYNNGNDGSSNVCNPYGEDDMEMLQNAADTVSEHNNLNISGRRYSSYSSDSEIEGNSVVLSRSASDQSIVIEDNTEDQVSTHSASEEISGIIKSHSQKENYSPRDIGVLMKTDTPYTYSDISEGPVVHRQGSIEDEDSAPLRHRFGIDESVLPIPERSVSADNIPKQVSTLKDMNRSRSTSMLDMAVVDNDESESGIFPPALSYVDEDQTEVSVSLRTMSEGALDQISQRSLSDRAVTFSDQTSSDLQSSEMESSLGVRSVCSNASSIEEMVEEYTINYSTNNPRLQSTAEDEDERILEEEEHIKEVLRTVEKFFLPKPALANKATSTEPVDVTVAELDEQSPTFENSTQTSQVPTVLQPNQIILPALSAPFRSQSVDSFGLGSYTQDIELSEGAQNWCTLGELMVETTHLLRTINEKLPNLERRGSVSSEESQAILKQWQEISVQTGSSMQDLQTVGLQTTEHDEKTVSLNCGTQTDKDFRMETLETTEMETTDLIPLTEDILVREVSVQTGEDTTEETDGGSQDSTNMSNEQLTPTDNDTKVTEAAQGIYTEDTVVPSLVLDQQTVPNTTANTRTAAQFIPQVKAELGLDQPLSSDLPTGDTSSNTTSPGISPRGVRPALTLPNTPEVEELRKEHNKLMENLRKASENRKARKDAIKSRKQVPVDLSISDKATDDNNTVQHPDTLDANSSFTRSSVSSSLTSPQDFVKIDIQIDPNTGVTVENKFFQERQKRDRNVYQPDEIHEHSWKLLRDKDTSKSASKPETRGSRQRNSSGASASSTDTTESSEVATVMSSPSTNPVDYAAERAGALNPMFMNEVVDDVIEPSVLSNSKCSPSSLLDRMTRNLQMKPEESQPVFSMSESEPESTVEDDIIPQHYSKKETLPSTNRLNEVVDSSDPRERRKAQHPVFIRSETSPKVKTQSQYPPPPESPGSVSGKSVDSSSSSDLKPLRKDLLPHLLRSKPGSQSFANEDIIVPEKHNREHALPASVRKHGNEKPGHFESDSASEDDKVVEDQVEPVNYNRNHAAPPKFKHSDDSTQVSVEFSDDCTQTDPDTSIESVITQTKAKPIRSTPSRKDKPQTSSKDSKSPETFTNELEKLQDQRLHMIEMLNMSHVPPSLTVELLEAKLNYCIGQTDLLLDGIEDNVREDSTRITSNSSNEQQKTIDYITKYRAALKKSKEDINECRNRLNKKSEVGIGRGRTPIRRRDMQMQWQIDAFKLERRREQQDYERSRHNTPNRGNTPHQGNTPLYGNTPLLGNSPVVTPRSTDRSRSSSPTYSAGYMTPKEHKGHLVDLRRQLIAEVMEEERQYRSQSPATSVSPPPRNTRPRDGSLGFSPKTSVSSFDVPERSSPTYNMFSVPPGRSPPSPKRLPFNRYKSPSETKYPETFDTRTVAESIFSPQESEAILREIEELKKKTPSMSAPIEEMLRRSSFSSTSSQRPYLKYLTLFSSTPFRRSGSSRTEPFLSPRSHSDSRTPRKSTSPVARQPDYSQPLSLNLDSLNDDDSQPYSPYSAYAREHVLPRERSPGGAGGVVRGTYELYNSRSDSQSDSSSVLSFGSDLDISHRPRINSLDEETVKRLRPVCADDIKARLGRHKR